jgi:hypothetical protein
LEIFQFFFKTHHSAFLKKVTYTIKTPEAFKKVDIDKIINVDNDTDREDVDVTFSKPGMDHNESVDKNVDKNIVNFENKSDKNQSSSEKK